MKALVLAAGNGTHFAAGSKLPIHKCLVQVGPRHVAEFCLDRAVRLQVEEIVMVVGHLGKTVMDTFKESYCGVPISYAVQTQQYGLVHAMNCGQEALGKADFWLFLADEVLLGADHDAMFVRFQAEEAFVSCGMVATGNLELVRKNYSIDFDEQSQRVLRLVEKPEQPFNSFIGTGNCLFRNEIFRYVAAMPNDPRTGRKELVGLIQAALEDGRKVLSHQFRARHYVNMNTVEDCAALEEILSSTKL